MAESPDTVTEAVQLLTAEGYDDDLRLVDGLLRCGLCSTSHPTDGVEVDAAFRFEGPSDPGDEAIVLGLRCPSCGARGSLVSAFGAGADPELATAFTYLAARAKHS
ncbi:MAG: phosphoribosylpyrophosphate synthetase [Acidimicrobiales bacterium]